MRLKNKFISESLPVLQVLQSCNQQLAKEIFKHASPAVLKAIINIVDLAFGVDDFFSLKHSTRRRLFKHLPRAWQRNLREAIQKKQSGKVGKGGVRGFNQHLIKSKLHLVIKDILKHTLPKLIQYGDKEDHYERGRIAKQTQASQHEPVVTAFIEPKQEPADDYEANGQHSQFD